MSVKIIDMAESYVITQLIIVEILFIKICKHIETELKIHDAY